MTTRLTAPDAIERRLLDFAYTTNAAITPTALAYFAPCSIADAGAVLDDLSARGRIQMDVEDDGTLRYTLPGRATLGPGAAPQPPMPPPQPMALAPIVPRMQLQPYGAHYPRPVSPTLAAALSLFVPGAGQAYAGRWVSGVLWFCLVGAAYSLILPGLVLHLLCIISAASSANRLNSLVARTQLQLAASADQTRGLRAA